VVKLANGVRVWTSPEKIRECVLSTTFRDCYLKGVNKRIDFRVSTKFHFESHLVLTYILVVQGTNAKLV